MCIHIYVLVHIFELGLDALAARRLSDRQKDIEILLLCQMERSAIPRLLQRKVPRSPRVSKWEKGVLAVLAARFTALSKGTGVGKGLHE
jgi:hypothetical protein